jgi:4-alpha-glucanotransferase
MEVNLNRESLLLLCQHFGLDPGYRDIWGNTVEALPEVMRAALLSVAGGLIPSEAFDSLPAAESFITGRAAGRWLRSPILAASQDAPLQDLILPAGRYGLDIAWEDGGALRLTLESDGNAPLSWPASTPCSAGYHRLTISLGNRTEDYVWILSPGHTWRETEESRAFGVSCFLPSLRSQRNWGCGDFQDLKDFAHAFASEGFDYIALNPLHALANRLPYNASPYSPLSLLRLNFIYMNIEALPEFTRSAALRRLVAAPSFEERLAALRNAEYVDYEGVARIKRLALKLAFREFLRKPDPAFEAWRETREPWLSQFGRYMALWHFLHRRDPKRWIWQDWPEPFRDPASPETNELAERFGRELRFEAWVQWRLEEQLAGVAESVRTAGYRLGLYNDLAVACDKAGPDRWANPSLFAQGLRIGSPPDDFNVNGQDWGFPALRPLHHCPDVLNYFRESLRACARSAGVIRLDHVMRLARLYSIPDGHPAREGIYVRDHFRALLHIIALESHRHRAIVVGEDLGTVPEYFRSALDEFGILSYRLVMFEWHGSDLKPPEYYPSNALCSFSTHDLATFDGYLSASDLESRKAVGFLSDEAYPGALDERRRNVEALARAFQESGAPANADDFFERMLVFLSKTPCKLVLLSLDELLGEKIQMNLPGTTHEHPNWRLKARVALENFGQDATLQTRLRAWSKARITERR